MSFAERLLKKRMLAPENNICMDTRFLLPTCKICERMFSKAGYALPIRRKAISSEKFEQQSFLHVNREFWSVSDVESILDSEKLAQIRKQLTKVFPRINFLFKVNDYSK